LNWPSRTRYSGGKRSPASRWLRSTVAGNLKSHHVSFDGAAMASEGFLDPLAANSVLSGRLQHRGAGPTMFRVYHRGRTPRRVLA
jgi:hypothetical protein